MQYYVAQQGKQTGPFDAATVAGMVTSGTVTRETLVWRKGMPAWEAAGKLDDLRSYFESVPPPLPG
ncbi:MAG: DUF4339 domain-containing protein [Chitinivibrionales bacterium]|nr:DUF4339 domain-containing protein [Chitinivibrionales bacterium]